MLKKIKNKISMLISKNGSNLWFIFFMGVGIFGISFSAQAAEYYVEVKSSAEENVTDEGEIAWNDAQSINFPTSAETAMKRAVAGDTVYFRGGAYELNASSIAYSGEYGYQAILQPENSGTINNPIVFKAYGNEIPLLNGHVIIKISGIAGVGTDSNHLVDTSVDFTALGVENWDVFRTGDKEGGAAIDTVSAHEVIFYTGTHNTNGSLVAGDSYEISDRFITTPIGVWRQEYITIDGFKIQSDNRINAARIIMSNHSVNFNAKGLIIKNCDIYGGDKDIVHGDNREGVRIERTEGAVVKNCRVYGFNSVNNNHNTGAFKTYDNDDLIFENNEIYDSTNGIYIKRKTDGANIRNNYIHNNYEGIIITSYISVEYSSERNIFIYNNIIAHSENATISDNVQETSDSDNMHIYDNTFYTGDSKAISVSLGPGRKFFYNNILVGRPRDYDIGHLKFSSNNPIDNGKSFMLIESDFNLVDPLNSPQGLLIRTINYDDNNERVSANYWNLNDWTTSGELDDGTNPGLNSFIADPLFLNISGSMTQMNDFEIAQNSPCRGAGKNGTNIGADISLVGIQNGNNNNNLRADVDQSGTINSTDAMLTLRNSLGLSMTGTNWQASANTGDVNCDGNSNSTDAMLILRYSLGLDMNGTGWCGN